VRASKRARLAELATDAARRVAGGVATNIWPWYVAWLAKLVMINVAQGAGTQTHVSASPTLRGHGFEYWTPSLVGAPHHVRYAHAGVVDSDEVGAKLIALVERMIRDRVGQDGWTPTVDGALAAAKP